MKKNPKGEQIDLFYSNDKKKKKNTKTKKKKKKVNSNEIIVNVIPKNKKTKKPVKKKTSVNSKRKPKTNQKANIKQKRGPVFKIMLLLVIALICIIIFLISPVFNIKEITVEGINRIDNNEIIRVSGIKKDENMFKINVWKTKEDIKKNPYVAEVQIKRSLNGTVNIIVKERTPKYMVRVNGKYIYVDNQGYTLEQSTEQLKLPILLGLKTDMSKIEIGERLIQEDLLKLNTVIEIIESAKINNIDKLIKEINISNSKEYVLMLKTEGKVVHFGDETQINQKIAWIAYLIKEEKGKEGEIFVNNIYKDNVFFREKI